MHVYPSVRRTLFIGTAAAAIYVIVYVAYLCSVVGKFRILHGYPRASDLFPGPFVSDRYTWGWYFLAINTVRGLFPFAYLYSLLGLKEADKRIWFERAAGWVIVFDLVLFIFFTVTICILCNNTYFPESLCNDSPERWCALYGPDHVDRCPSTIVLPPGSPPLPTDQCELDPNPIFYRWIFFSFAFSLLDLLLLMLNWDMNTHVSLYLRYE